MAFSEFADSSVYLGTLQLPHVTSFNVSKEWEQTELPIERGAVISDHRRKRPVMINLTGYVTGQIELVPNGAGSLLPANAILVRAQLELLEATGQTFLVKFGPQTWANMSIVSHEEDHSAERRDDMYSFSLGLKETRVATSTVVGAVPVDPGIADLAAAPVDGGLQAGSAVGPETAGAVTGVLGGGV